MADNLTTQSATPATVPASSVIATDDVSGVHFQKVKIDVGGDGASVVLSSSNPLPVSDAGGALTVDGTVAVTQSGTWDEVGINDSGNSITVDAPVGTPAFVRLSDGSSAITTLPVSAAALPLPSGASSLAEQQSQTTHLATIAGDTTDIETAVELIDDTVATLGTTTYTETTTKGLIIGAIRRDADTTLVDTTNEIAPLQVDASGRLKVEAFSGETLPVSLTSTTVTGTVAVTQSGTWDEVGINDSGNSITVDYATTGSGTATGAVRVELPTNGTGVIATVGAVTAITNALPSGTNAIGKLAANSGVDIGDVDITSIAAGDNNIGNVDIASIAAGDNNIGNVDVVSLPASTNTIEVVGDIAHDTGVSGNPVQIAGAAQNMDDTAPPNRVSAESDTTRLATDWDGAIFAHPHGPQIWTYHLDTSTAQTDAEVHAAPASGLSLYVTDIVFSSVGTAAINLFFEEGSTKKLGPYYLPAVAGGVRISFNTPKKITAATALTLTTSASHAHSVDVQGYTGQG